MAIKMDPEGVYIVRCYDKKESPPDFVGDIGNETSRTEIFMLKDNGIIVHKRPNIRFLNNWTPNDNSIAYQQRRTYRVENIVDPGSISRSGYIFKGWATTRSSSTPMTFPRDVPSTPESQDFVDYGYAIWEAEESPTTVAPTVGTPSCISFMGISTVSVSITNNQNATVTIKNGKITLGTLSALANGTFEIAKPAIPYNYNINITAQASGYDISTAVNRTGTITTCQWI